VTARAASCALAASLATVGVLAAGASASASRRAKTLVTGFNESAYQDSDRSERTAALAHTIDARGSIVRLVYLWAEIAPSPPPSSALARDPSWPGYRWSALDPVIADAISAGLQPVLILYGAPSWAEGSGRPASAAAGTWRPSVPAFRDFAEAAARRYSGTIVDPAAPGRVLPRVRYWQAWDEPNLDNYLTPQWASVGGRLMPASPDYYRDLLGAFYDGVKSPNRANVVLTAGTGPFGDPPGGRRIPPAEFVRDLLCVRGRQRPRPFRCPGLPAKFDVLAHHPYSVGSPVLRALNADDVEIPDFAKLSQPLDAAVRAGHTYPRGRKRLWATEFSWDSKPPDPGALPISVQARYLEGAFYVLWNQGVDAVTWFLLRDQAEGRGWQYTYQSGIYYRGASVADDRRKPSFEAFRFPFTAYYRRRGVVELWGLAPTPGRVAIQARRAGRWRTLTVLSAGTGRLFRRSMRIRRGTVLRARMPRGEVSLDWRVAARL
jgi:hypothetical protein